MSNRKRATGDGKIEKRRQHVSVLLCTMARPSVRRVREALTQLAEPIEVGKSTVARDIDAIRREWKDCRLDNMDEYVGEELEKLRLMEERAWHGMNAALRPYEETITKTRAVPVRNADGELEQREVTDRQVVRREGRLDPRILRNLVEIQDRRAKLLGLDAPKGLDLTSGGRTLSFTVDIGAEDWETPKLSKEQKKLVSDLEAQVTNGG